MKRIVLSAADHHLLHDYEAAQERHALAAKAEHDFRHMTGATTNELVDEVIATLNGCIRAIDALRRADVGRAA